MSGMTEFAVVKDKQLTKVEYVLRGLFNYYISLCKNERLVPGSTPLDYLHTLGHTGTSTQRLKSHKLSTHSCNDCRSYCVFRP
jgi:hypothetical protein